MNSEDLNNNEKSEKDYELSFLLKEASHQAAVLNILKKYQIVPAYESPPIQIRLAYPIKKQTSAFFGFCYFRAETEALLKIKEELDLDGEILRFLIIASPAKPAVREKVVPRPPDTKSPEPAIPTLSNEALEEKLEEILK